MGRLYTATFSAVAVSAAQDLFELVAGTNKPIIIHAIFIGQSSDAGDAEDELLRIAIIRGATTSGSGGSSATPTPLKPGDAAFGGTAEVNNTTQATDGTPLTLHADSFNVRAGWVYMPTPEMRPVANGGQRIVVALPAAPADALTMSGTIYFEEAA